MIVFVVCGQHSKRAVVIPGQVRGLELRTCPRLGCGLLERCLVCLIADERHYHAVQIEEEHDQMEAELNERFLRAC